MSNLVEHIQRGWRQTTPNLWTLETRHYRMSVECPEEPFQSFGFEARAIWTVWDATFDDNEPRWSGHSATLLDALDAAWKCTGMHSAEGRLNDAIATHEASRLLGAEQGRAEERARCVAWLRERADRFARTRTDPNAALLMYAAANAIERGEHVKATSPP